MKNPLGREGNQRAGEGGRNENKERALQERMSERRMATTARGELLRLGLQGWKVPVVLVGGGALKWRGAEVIRLRPGWWLGHTRGEVEHGMESKMWEPKNPQ